jgi:para-aminobenzoate synthetase component I
MNNTDFIDCINTFAEKRIPFIFLVDFEKNDPLVYRLEDADKNGLFFDIKGKTNYSPGIKVPCGHTIFEISPVDKNTYDLAFQMVKDHLLNGNTYLLNLTFPTQIRTNMSLEYLFYISKAKYKLWFKDHFILFSPECFIRTDDNFIYSYPMKGTIDATIPNAEKILLEDEKETWEHNTIVDLIRNDLAMVSSHIDVIKYRYIDHIITDRNELLQVSSEIRGKLSPGWQSGAGELLMTLLPAGSVSGAPKQKTVEIIQKAEGQPRGYFTGIFGIFDGKNMDSAVNIRFIELKDRGLQYRSGGGITAMSQPDKEYKEMINKVYVPFI